MIRKSVGCVFLLVVGMIVLSVPGWTQEDALQNRSDNAALIELLEKKGVITFDEAYELKQRALQEPAPQVDENRNLTKPAEPPSRPSEEDLKTISREVAKQIREDVKEEVKDDIKVEMAESDEVWLDRLFVSVPEWSRRVRLSGDVRLRYEGNFLDDNNPDDWLDPADLSLKNTQIDRNRFRYRARLGLTAEVNHQVTAGFRLATGSTSNPISTNETAGDYFNKDYFLLDQAYLKIHPFPTMPETALWGGRFANPFFCTDLVWDSDLQFEGVALKFDAYATDWLRPMLTAGWFPIQESEWYDEKYLMGGQMAFEIKPRTDLILTVGAAYYDYHSIKGEAWSPTDPDRAAYTRPLYQQLGNSLIYIEDPPDSGNVYSVLAGDYRLLDACLNFDIALFHPVHVVLTGNYVENIGFDPEEVARRWGVESWEDETTAYQVGISVGHPSVRNFSEWNVAFDYRYIEADAVLDAFTDSDFHLGGTNAKGWIMSIQFGLTKNLWLATKWSTSDTITREPLAIDVLQVDLNAKF